MSILLRHKKILSLVLIFSFTVSTVCFSTAHARMISTAQILKTGQVDSDREALKSFLERKDVQKQLEEWGLDKEMAGIRLGSLTDEEVSQMARQLDKMPSGGDGLGMVVGAAVLIFLVLLLTDILGFTDVFPFTK